MLTNSELQTKVYQYAEKYGTSGKLLTSIIDCEDRDWNVSQQSYSTYKSGNRWGFPAGTREKSYGLAQIHLPDHKTITYDQATDPDFSIDYLAKNVANGTDTWSCYKK